MSDLKKSQPLKEKLLLQQQGLEFFESKIILKKAQSLAIEIPKQIDKPDWWADNSDNDDIPYYAVTQWLTETGRIGVRQRSAVSAI